MKRIRTAVSALAALAVLGLAPVAAQSPSFPVEDQISAIQGKPCDGEFSFAVMVDGHDSDTIHPALLQLAADMGADFIIHGGDFTNNGEDEEYARVIDQVRALGVPWLPVPGNHEYRSPDGRTTTTGRVRFRRVFGVNEYSFEYCGWQFVTLDVVAMDTLTFGQTNWLEREVENAGGNAVVVMHYPPGVFKGYEGYFTGNAQNYVDILERHGVKLAFYGHFHNFDRIEVGPTTHYIAGVSGGGLREGRVKYHDPAGGSYYGFLFVTIEDDEPLVSIIRPMDLERGVRPGY